MISIAPDAAIPYCLEAVCKSPAVFAAEDGDNADRLTLEYNFKNIWGRILL